MSAFANYIGIDYSGAKKPISSLKGLRVYLAEGNVLRHHLRRDQHLGIHCHLACFDFGFGRMDTASPA